VARVRAKLDVTPKVQNANPLGAVLEHMIGAMATALTAWQQAIVAAVFEFCLVGVMVIFELLGHIPQAAQQDPTGTSIQPRAEIAHRTSFAVALQETMTPPPPPRRKSATVPKVGSVKTILRDSVLQDDGERAEMKTLILGYRAWCAQTGCRPLDLPAFRDEIEKLFRKQGVMIEVGDDQRVYCLGVMVDARLQTIASAVH
jgi:hypothetical protein